MEAIYPFSALKTNQREVKDAALEGVVHVTENGRGAFVFCSEDVFDRKLREAAEEAVYAERMAAAIRQGREDIEEGRCVEGTAAALDAIWQRANRYAI
ncbi:MAG: hypothetical protein Q4B69_02565 [Slackia sp.]|nr:hypothetical protein [Slackia sp.]